MVDAMLHHTAPIVLDTSAPGEIVTPECGWKIPVSRNEAIIENLATAIMAAHTDRDLLARKCHAARKRILSSYSKDRYLDHIDMAYEKAYHGKNNNS